MFNIFKASLGLIGLSLMVCQSVNADSNDNERSSVRKSISMVGVISDLSTEVSIADVTVKIRLNGLEGIPASVNSGAFQIDNLPANTNFELIVHSTKNAFADKIYFGKTRETNSMHEVYQDLGILSIAAGNNQKLEASSRL
jgi:hypothetical protein